MSAGVTFGLKLPTGNDTHDMTLTAIIDRDTELGTGSTDLLLGGFYRHTLNSVTRGLYWFAQAKLDVPTFIQDQYRPGVELDTALGLYYQHCRSARSTSSRWRKSSLANGPATAAPRSAA